MGSLLENQVDDLLRDEVGQAEVGAGDGDEAEHDPGRLRDLAAVRPLDALELGPRGAQEVGDAVAPRPRAGGRPPAALDAPGRARRRLAGAARRRWLVFGAVAAAPNGGRLQRLLVEVARLAVGTRDDRGLDLVDLARRVVQLTRDVLAMDRVLLGLAVARALTVACHGSAAYRV